MNQRVSVTDDLPSYGWFVVSFIGIIRFINS